MGTLEISREPHKDFIWWEDCKEAFKSLIVFHSKRLSRARRREINRLEHDLAFFRSLEASDPSTYADEVHCLRDQLNAAFNSNLEGAKIRSKVSQLEGDEKPKFYLRKEVSHAQDKYISDLLVNGETITGKDDIIDACRDFYVELYTAEPVDDAVI